MRGLTCTVQLDSPRWYFYRPSVGWWVQVRPCGVGCWLYLAGPPRSPAYECHHGGRDGPLDALVAARGVSQLLPGRWQLWYPSCGLVGRIPLMHGKSSQDARYKSHPPTGYIYLAGAWVRGLTRTCQRDRRRWYHSRPFVAMACMLYLAGSAACLAGSSPCPSCRISESGCEV